MVYASTFTVGAKMSPQQVLANRRFSMVLVFALIIPISSMAARRHPPSSPVLSQRFTVYIPTYLVSRSIRSYFENCWWQREPSRRLVLKITL